MAYFFGFGFSRSCFGVFEISWVFLLLELFIKFV